MLISFSADDRTRLCPQEKVRLSRRSDSQREAEEDEPEPGYQVPGGAQKVVGGQHQVCR